MRLFFRRAVLFGLVLSWALPASAQTTITSLLSSNSAEDPPLNPACLLDGTCYTCDFIVFAIRVAEYILISIGAVMVVTFVVSGVLLIISRGDANIITRASGILKGAVIGIALTFTSYLIVNYAINSALIPIGGATVTAQIFTPRPWDEIECQEDRPIFEPSSGEYVIGGFTENPDLRLMSESKARDFLSSCGVGVKAACAEGESSGCVSLEGVTVEAVDLACNAAETCGLGPEDVYITGGTEGEHEEGEYSHEAGYKLDFRSTDNLKNCVFGNPAVFEYSGTRKGSHGGSVYCDKHGGEWVYETNPVHFDVTIGSAPSTYCG